MINQRPSFFKIILPFQHVSKQLQIPPKFIKHIEKEKLERVTLRGPSGCCWPVKLRKNTNGIFLTDGWHRFFEAHSLGNYEVLVFMYSGRMCFNVRIFGNDGLERANVPENDDSRELISLENDSGDQIESESESESEEVYVAKLCHEATPISERRKRGRPRKDSGEGKEIEIIGDGTSNMKRKRGRPRKHPLVDGPALATEVGESEALATEVGESEEFCSVFPFFEQRIDRNKLKRLYEFPIPGAFREKYLPNKKTKMTLRNKEGNSWEVNVIPCRTSVFAGGWSCFLKDNKLELGDLCIFELVKETEMQVHIFRSSEESQNRLKN